MTPISESWGAVYDGLGQVFWLPDLSLRRAFPARMASGLLRRASPVTAAGPRRVLTVFPCVSSEETPIADMSERLYSFRMEKSSRQGAVAAPFFAARLSGKCSGRMNSILQAGHSSMRVRINSHKELQQRPDILDRRTILLSSFRQRSCGMPIP